MKLVSHRFLGRSCTVDMEMAARLSLAENYLKDQYALYLQLVGVEKALRFDLWHGVHSVGGHRKGGGWHGKGQAIDVDYTNNPYIATRSGSRYGGEAAGASLGVRKVAVDVCDRAVGAVGAADLSGRRSGESTGQVWSRFEFVSSRLRTYFAPYFRTDKALIERRPVFGKKLADFQVLVESGELYVPTSEVPLQVLQDYELVRIPMVVGSPSKTPAVTRNPARGFMNLTVEVTVALCDAGGLRWGMSDFGSAESGDGQHFDMGRKYLV